MKMQCRKPLNEKFTLYTTFDYSSKIAYQLQLPNGQTQEVKLKHSYLQINGTLYQLPLKGEGHLGAGSFAKVKLGEEQLVVRDRQGTPRAIKIVYALPERQTKKPKERILRPKQVEREIEISRKAGILHASMSRSAKDKDGRLITKFYLVLDYYSGGEFFNYLAQHVDSKSGIWSAQEQMQIALQLCNLVDALHREGIAHRDLKSENILLDGENRLHLADFGLSEYLEDSEKPAVSGSAAYAPVELRKKRDEAHSNEDKKQLRIYHDTFSVLRMLQLQAGFKLSDGTTFSMDQFCLFNDMAYREYPGLKDFVNTADGKLKRLSPIQLAANLILLKHKIYSKDNSNKLLYVDGLPEAVAALDDVLTQEIFTELAERQSALIVFALKVCYLNRITPNLLILQDHQDVCQALLFLQGKNIQLQGRGFEQLTEVNLVGIINVFRKAKMAFGQSVFDKLVNDPQKIIAVAPDIDSPHFNTNRLLDVVNGQAPFKSCVSQHAENINPATHPEFYKLLWDKRIERVFNQMQAQQIKEFLEVCQRDAVFLQVVVEYLQENSDINALVEKIKAAMSREEKLLKKVKLPDGMLLSANEAIENLQHYNEKRGDDDKTPHINTFIENFDEAKKEFLKEGNQESLRKFHAEAQKQLLKNIDKRDKPLFYAVLSVLAVFSVIFTIPTVVWSYRRYKATHGNQICFFKKEADSHQHAAKTLETITPALNG